MMKTKLLSSICILIIIPSALFSSRTEEIKVVAESTNNVVEADTEEDESVYSEFLNHRTFSDEQEQIRDEIFYGEMELLAQLIHAEAGNQDLTGKRLVADVVLNRVEAGFNHCDNMEQVIFFENAFSSIKDGNFDKAAWNITEEDYLAAEMEMTGERLDYSIFYFSAEGYSKYGKPAYKYGDHYFSTR